MKTSLFSRFGHKIVEISFKVYFEAKISIYLIDTRDFWIYAVTVNMYILYIKEWVTGTKSCWTRDQDVLRKCEPVNCIYKYSGLRNYFDENDQLCKKTTPCFSDPASKLPKQVGIGSFSHFLPPAAVTQEDCFVVCCFTVLNHRARSCKDPSARKFNFGKGVYYQVQVGHEMF